MAMMMRIFAFSQTLLSTVSYYYIHIHFFVGPFYVFMFAYVNRVNTSGN